MSFKIKKLILPTIFSLCLAGITGYFLGTNRGVKEVLSNHEVAIMANAKQIPYHAKFLKVVEELERASKGKLMASECVRISEIITSQCILNNKIGLTSDKVFAIMERESNFSPDAISRSHAYGIMQLIPTTFMLHSALLGYSGNFHEDLALNPIVNTEVGIQELIRLRKYWLSEGVNDWLVVYTSYFWGTRSTWELFLSKKRAKLPSLEYSKGIIDLAKKWRERGIS